MKLLDKWFSRKWRQEYVMFTKNTIDENMTSQLKIQPSSTILGGGSIHGMGGQINLTKSNRPDPSISFNVHPAHNGGFVVEYNTWDQLTSCYEKRLHIIGSDQDLGQGISHIITVEMLRR